MFNYSLLQVNIPLLLHCAIKDFNIETAKKKEKLYSGISGSRGCKCEEDLLRRVALMMEAASTSETTGSF
jgi:hypothetical protein